MTIKDAILLSLEDFPNGATGREVYENILQRRIFEFNKEAKTPDATMGMSALNVLRTIKMFIVTSSASILPVQRILLRHSLLP